MNQRYVRLLVSAGLILSVSISLGRAQNAVPQNSIPTQSTGSRISTPAAGTASTGTAGATGGGGKFVLSEYALGPGDQITINAIDAEEISGRTILIGSSGNIDVPL